MALARGTVSNVLWYPRRSVIIDSPLSPKGIEQARAFAKTVGKKLSAEAGPANSVLVTSNQRRAMATAALCFMERVSCEPVTVDNVLQETSPLGSPGTLSLMPAQRSKALRGDGGYDIPGLPPPPSGDWSGMFTAPFQTGNKRPFDNGFERMRTFARRAVGDEGKGYTTATGAQPAIVLVAGHSHWFRDFFRLFLPRESTHRLKRESMRNTEAVAFDLVVGANGVVSVPESSIAVVTA